MTGVGAEGSPVEPILISDAERQAVVERLNGSLIGASTSYATCTVSGTCMRWAREEV
ncbi:MAG TPA: hypothetical protein VGG38_00870 [Acidimicrobiales bacterium]|jgi:hypothetical protein